MLFCTEFYFFVVYIHILLFRGIVNQLAPRTNDSKILNKISELFLNYGRFLDFTNITL